MTGASSGIGFELAKQFAQNGLDLLICSGSEAIEQAANELRGLGAKVEAIEADLASYEGVEQLYNAIQSSGRALDAVAINAGVTITALMPGFANDSTRQSDRVQRV